MDFGPVDRKAPPSVIVLLLWLLLAGWAGDTWCQAGLALIAGGAAGNLL